MRQIGQVSGVNHERVLLSTKFAGLRNKCPPPYEAGKANFQHEIRHCGFHAFSQGNFTRISTGNGSGTFADSQPLSTQVASSGSPVSTETCAA